MDVQLLTGDCIEVLKTLPDASVHCVVTSPPYWGLRDYGTATWEGGNPECDHYMPALGGPAKSGLSLKVDADGYTIGKTQPNKAQYPHICAKCGARRIDRQIGLEKSPEEYVSTIVDVFREVWRVLRDDGTLWLNLGDSYVANGSNQVPQTKHHIGSGFAGPNQDGMTGLAPKNLVGIPWRVAFALQANGWYLRSDIIWAKPNPMPESVTDRPTKAHEYLFLLSKSERYFYDQEAIAEPVAPGTVLRLGQPTLDEQQGSDRANGGAKTNGRMKAVPPRFGGNKYGDNDAEEHRTKSGNEYEIGDGKRNRRTVWTVATQPYAEAHFATFPPALVEPCILAGCPAGGTVLDPFSGSGTTAAVALSLGRNAVGIELNPEYTKLAEKRIAGITPALFGL